MKKSLIAVLMALSPLFSVEVMASSTFSSNVSFLLPSISFVIVPEESEGKSTEKLIALINSSFEEVITVEAAGNSHDCEIKGWKTSEKNPYDVAVAGREFVEKAFGAKGVGGNQAAWITALGNGPSSLYQITKEKFKSDGIYTFSVSLAASNNMSKKTDVGVEIIDESGKAMAVKKVKFNPGGSVFLNYKVRYAANGEEKGKIGIRLSTSINSGGVIFIDNAKLTVNK